MLRASESECTHHAGLAVFAALFLRHFGARRTYVRMQPMEINDLFERLIRFGCKSALFVKRNLTFQSLTKLPIVHSCIQAFVKNEFQQHIFSTKPEFAWHTVKHVPSEG